jgi:N-acetylglutamate synthase-like GNAT family acetyltransferase
MISADIAIVPFEPRHARAFRELNIAWVERYFGTVEEMDSQLLNAPEERITNKGGAILIVEDRSGNAIGCVALVPAGEGVLELVKMAVADDWQGKGVGGMLLDAAIAKARELGARAVYLESNSSLKPAMRLYERAGFQHLSAEQRPRSPYARCNVHMRLEL